MSNTCLSCDVKFSNKSLLQRHFKISTTCEPPKFECDYCTYSTPFIHNLRRHLNTCKMKSIIDEEKETFRDTEINSLIIDYEVKLTLKDEEISALIIDHEEKLALKDEEISALMIDHEEKLALKDEEIDTIKISKDKKIDTLKAQLGIEKKKNKAFKQQITNLNLQLAEKKGMLLVKQGKTINIANQKLLKIKCSTIDPFTIQTVQKAVNTGGYTFQHFKLGPEGIIDFIRDIICKDDQRNYACSDISRNKCHRLIETRDWEADNGATFIRKVLDQLKEPVLKHQQQVIALMSDKNTEELGDSLRERTRDTVTAVLYPDSKQREELFTKVRSEVKNLTAV